jgi:hypothetical protein
MKPDAKSFFYENNGSSRLLLWFRDHAVAGRLWIPKKGDADEEPLTPHEVAILEQYFSVTHNIWKCDFSDLLQSTCLVGNFTDIPDD